MDLLVRECFGFAQLVRVVDQLRSLEHQVLVPTEFEPAAVAVVEQPGLPAWVETRNLLLAALKSQRARPNRD